MTRPSRIIKTMATWKRKHNPRRAVMHLDFVREIGICLACGAVVPRCEAMHVRNKTDGGTGLKPSDKFSVPGCTQCHIRQHKVGEVTFWGEIGIDPLDVSCRLWTISGDVEAGRTTVLKARQRAALRRNSLPSDEPGKWAEAGGRVRGI